MEFPTLDYIVFDGETLNVWKDRPNTIEEFHKAVKCDCIQGLTSTELGLLYGLDIYLDDNGKLYGQDTITGLFVRDGKVIDFMVGNILICRHDDDGDSVSVKTQDVGIIAEYIRLSVGIRLADGFPWKLANKLLVLNC